MNQWKRLLTGGLVVVVIAAVAVVALALILPSPVTAAPAASNLSWQVIAAGGQTMSGPSYTMLSTAGQPIAGTSSSANYTQLSGYWYGIQEIIREIFLPIILRN